MFQITHIQIVAKAETREMDLSQALAVRQAFRTNNDGEIGVEESKPEDPGSMDIPVSSTVRCRSREQSIIKRAVLNMLGMSEEPEGTEKVPSLYVCGSPGTGKTLVVVRTTNGLPSPICEDRLLISASATYSHMFFLRSMPSSPTM